MSKNAIMEAIKKSLGDTLNEDVASEVSKHIDQLVSDRSAAKTLELSEKVKKLSQENKSLKETITKQEKEFKEEAEKFATELAEAFAQKESILFEELENYKEETVKVIQEVSQEYRTAVENMVLQEANEYRTELEQVMIEAAKDFRLQQETALAEDVSAYQKDVLEKLDQFLEAELPNNIPDGLLEAVAKNKALEEIVEGVMGVFSEKSIKLDEASEKVLKDARSEYENLSESYNAKVKEAVSLTAKVRELEKEVKFQHLTEGMTSIQKKNARKLLENTTVSDIEKRFEGIKDLVIKESARPQNPTRVKNVQEEKVKPTAQAQKQLQNLKESIDNPQDTKPSRSELEMAAWKKSLEKGLRRQ